MNAPKKRRESLREYLENDGQSTIEKRLHELGGQIKRPPRSDPRHTDDSIPPGGRDVPAGGSTGEYMGGSANKRKGQAG
jgi:hypothetical protein